jgi:hypothetical protein
MTLLTMVLFAVSPYIGFLTIIWLFLILYKWAKKRKAAAIGLGMMMHALMPVPNVEESIIQVIEKKQIQEKKSAQTKKRRRSWAPSLSFCYAFRCPISFNFSNATIEPNLPLAV